MLGNNRLNRPGTLTDEVLQVADRHSQMQGHGFNRFVSTLAEQATQIHLGVLALVGTSKGRAEVRVIGGKLIEQAADISGCQIAFGRRAGVEYTLHGYRVPFTDRFAGVRGRISYPFVLTGVLQICEESTMVA